MHSYVFMALSFYKSTLYVFNTNLQRIRLKESLNDHFYPPLFFYRGWWVVRIPLVFPYNKPPVQIPKRPHKPPGVVGLFFIFLHMALKNHGRMF